MCCAPQRSKKHNFSGKKTQMFIKKNSNFHKMGTALVIIL